MLVVGVIVAGRVAQRTRNDAFVVAIPPAFAVFGGSFIHVTQIAAALPAAALLVAYAPRERRTLAVVALLALAVPWGWFDSPALLLAPLVPDRIFGVALLARKPRRDAARRDRRGGAAVRRGHAAGQAAPHAVAHAAAPAIDRGCPRPRGARSRRRARREVWPPGWCGSRPGPASRCCSFCARPHGRCAAAAREPRDRACDRHLRHAAADRRADLRRPPRRLAHGRFSRVLLRGAGAARGLQSLLRTAAARLRAQHARAILSSRRRRSRCRRRIRRTRSRSFIR